MSGLITLACGHIYSSATWKEGSSCFYCHALKNNTCAIGGEEYKHLRGMRMTKDGKRYMVRSAKQTNRLAPQELL